MKSKAFNQLENKRIIITRAEGQASEAKQLLERYGAQVLDLPALEIGAPTTWEPLDSAISNLNTFDWILFSSANGVKSIEERLKLSNQSLAKKPNHLKIAAVGKKTAQHLELLGVKVDFIPPDFISESLIENFPVTSFGLKILLPRVESGGRALLANAFTNAGATVEEVAAYESYCPNQVPSATLAAINKAEVDIIAFCSGKTVANTAKLLTNHIGEHWLKKLERVKIVSIGPQTTKCCIRWLKRFDKEAKPHNLEGLINACIE